MFILSGYSIKELSYQILYKNIKIVLFFSVTKQIDDRLRVVFNDENK